MASGLTGGLLAANQAFYDGLWSGARLIGPERFSTWPLVQALAGAGGLRLEIGPGLRPRLPLLDTVFADISLPALRPLAGAGGHAAAALATALPFKDGAFRLVSAMDIVEHVADGEAAMAELARVSAPGAVLLLSVPLHQAGWTAFDVIVGHHRRYEPDALVRQLAAVGFTVEQSAASGMLPKSSRLQRLGLWFLQHQHARALWWYNRVFMPLGLRNAAALVLTPGMIGTAGVGGILLVCRKDAIPSGTHVSASRAPASGTHAAPG